MSDSILPQSHEHYMRLALGLAAKGQGLVEPNPMVGCVIVRDNEVIGQGYHQAFGGPHAEVNAIESVTHRQQLRDATLYVTLEPCCHTGKTPPCCDAIVAAGCGRVVMAMRDPFPSVDGGGIQRLQQAGIETTVGVLSDEAAQLNLPYLKRLREARPWVIAKWAMTADGKIATKTGESQWITGQESRRDVHRLRSRVDAIVTGMGTVAADNPTLTAREVDHIHRVAMRVVMCRQHIPSVDSNLIRSIDQAPLLIAAGPRIDETMLAPLRERGAVVWKFSDDDPAAMVDALLKHLCDLGCTNVMLEGGGAILASFAEADQIDECHVYVGPMVFGGTNAPGPIAGSGVERLADAFRLKLWRVEQFGGDVKLTYAIGKI